MQCSGKVVKCSSTKSSSPLNCLLKHISNYIMKTKKNLVCSTKRALQPTLILAFKLEVHSFYQHRFS